MAIPTHQGVVTTSGTSTTTTPDISSIDGGSAPTVGDLILVHISRGVADATVNQDITAPDGYHKPGRATNVENDIILWKNWESGDDTTPTFSWTGSQDFVCSVHCIRGHDKARPFARHSVNHYSSNTMSFLAETTPVANCLAIAMTTCDDNRAGNTPPGGWTERVDVGVGIALLTGLSQYAMTQGFASASTSTGNPTINMPGIGATSNISRMIVIQESQTPTPRNIRVKTGSSSSPTSTGNQDITGLGFDVKALIVYCVHQNTDAVSANLELMRGIGADDGVTTAAQRSAGVWHTSGGTTDEGYSDNGSIIKMYFSGNTTLGSPNLQATYSRITDGFRLNWTAVQGSAVTFNWIALGGADLRAVVGAAQASAGSVSGLPWRPDLVHIISQCIDSDADQIRDIGLLSSGWLDCQAGAWWWQAADLDGSANAFPHREAAFIGQAYAGALTWAAQFEQTTSGGWSWSGSNTDYFQYLALYFQNDTAFPYQVETLASDASGTNGADQTLPSFADGQTYGEKQLIHAIAGDDTTPVTVTNGGWSEGHVEFDGGSGYIRDIDVMAVGRNANTSERRRKLSDSFIISNSGDLDSPAKVGAFTDEDTIDWSVNNATSYLIGLATIGWIGQEYTRNPQDSVAVTDSVKIEMSYGRTVADSVNVTDAVTREHDASRPISDAAAVTDAVAAEMTFERSAADSVAVTDAVAREHDASRPVTDSVDVTDATATALSYERTITDTADATDQVSSAMEFERALSDAVAVTDQTDSEFTEGGVRVEDTVAVTDAVAVTVTFERSASDTVDVADFVSASEGRYHSDAVDVTDALTVATQYVRSAADAVAATDAVAVSLEQERSASDAVSVTDAVAVELEFERSVGDTVSVTDATQREHDAVRALADSVNVTDATSKTVEVDLADAVGVTDALAREHDASRPLADSVSVTDQTSTLVDVAATDNVAVAEQLVTEADYNRPLSDAVSVADQVTAERAQDRTVSDSISVTDAVAVELEFERTLADAIAVTDVAARELEAERAVTDAVSVADTTVGERVIVISDAVSVTDAIAREHNAARVISDAVMAADAVVASVEGLFAIEMNDMVDVTDAVVRATDTSRTLSDAAAVTDAASTSLEADRAAADTVSVTDQLAREYDASRALSDAVAAVDQTATGYEFDVALNDSVSVTDLAAREADDQRNVVDNHQVTDLVSVSLDISVALSDSVNVTDETFAGEIAIAINDSVAVTDLVSREHDASRSVADTADVTDSTTALVGEIETTDAVAVTDALTREADFSRAASDAAAVTDAVVVVFITPNVVITDSVDVTDTVNASFEVAAQPADALDVTDALEVEFTLGASASDAISVTDAVTADILNLDPDAVDVTDSVVRSVEYNRAIGDAVAVSDLAIEGEPQVYGETIDGGVVVGSVDAHTVDPYGPVSASGSPDCFTGPVGFVVETGDQVSCTDSFQAGLECHIVLNDAVAVAEV